MKKQSLIISIISIAVILLSHSYGARAEHPYVFPQDQVTLNNSQNRPVQVAQTTTSPVSSGLPVYDAAKYKSLAAAIAAIGTKDAVLDVSNEQSVTTNLTIPANVRLRFQSGGLLNIKPGTSVTINGPIEAGLFQIFAGSGIVNFTSGSVKEVYPQWWGAKADGKAEDTQAVQNAINAIAKAGGGDVIFVKGTYLVNNIVLDSNVNIVGKGWDSILFQKSGARYCCSINPGAGGTPDVRDNKHDITIRDIQLKGTVEKDGFSEHVHLLNMNAVTNITVTNCKLSGWRGDGLYIGSSNMGNTERHNLQVTITNCLFDGINNDNRNAISIIDGTGIVVDNNTFMNCTRPGMPGAVDIEPDRNTFAIIMDIIVTNNSFQNVGGAGGIITMTIPLGQKDLLRPARQILIEGNRINETFTSNLRADGIRLYQIQKVDDTTVANDLVVSRNVVKHTKRPYRLQGVKDVKFIDNTFEDSLLPGYVGTQGMDKCADVEFTDNAISMRRTK